MTENKTAKTNPLVLIADDDLELIDFLEIALRQENFDTRKSTDGDYIIRDVRKYKPDIILLDVDLPHKIGIEICNYLKTEQDTKFIPVIMMTGSDDSAIMVKCYEAGSDEYIRKPFSVVEMLTRVNAMLRLKLLRDELTEINVFLQNQVSEKSKKLHNVYIQSISSLVNILDGKDYFFKGHSTKVAEISVAIAKALDVNESYLVKIKEAAELHDLGKISIRDRILGKKGALTDEEREEIQTHSTVSAEILKPFTKLGGITEIVKYHHERFDGHGYPAGLKAEDIPLGSRIIAVADSYDAMTADRPYRKAMTPDKAIEEIKKHSGKQFDPKVVTAFLKSIKAAPLR